MDNERHALEVDRLLELSEVSTMLGLNERTLSRHYLKGKDDKPPRLKGRQNMPGGKWFVYESEVRRFIEERDNKS